MWRYGKVFSTIFSCRCLTQRSLFIKVKTSMQHNFWNKGTNRKTKHWERTEQSQGTKLRLIDHRLQITFVYKATKQTEVELFSQDIKRVADVPLLYFKWLTLAGIDQRWEEDMGIIDVSFQKGENFKSTQKRYSRTSCLEDWAHTVGVNFAPSFVETAMIMSWILETNIRNI